MIHRYGLYLQAMADEDVERWHIRIAPDTWIWGKSMRYRRRADRLMTWVPRVPCTVSESIGLFDSSEGRAPG